jgi:hypothetical protein
MTLDLATSHELVGELFRRYPDAIFCGMKQSPSHPESAQVYSRFQGHALITQGMCTKMLRKIQDAEEVYPQETEEDL